jgi:quercetin dioxygenase-like cupin family protein
MCVVEPWRRNQLDPQHIATEMHLMFFATAALAGVTAMTAHAAAPLKRTPIATDELSPSRAVATVHVVRLDFAPGQPTSLHKHPVPVIGYVLHGSFTVQVNGQPAHTYTEGQSIYEPADTQIDRFDNASKTDPATLIATYLAGPGQKDLITFLPEK